MINIYQDITSLGKPASAALMILPLGKPADTLWLLRNSMGKPTSTLWLLKSPMGKPASTVFMRAAGETSGHTASEDNA